MGWSQRSLAFALSFAQLIPFGHTFEYALTRADHVRTQNLLNNVASTYREAYADYQKKGPEAFLAPWMLAAKDQSEFRNVYLRSLPKLPELTIIDDHTFELNSAGESSVVRVQIVSLDEKKVLINGKNFTYDSRDNLSGNAINIQNLLTETSIANRFESLWINSAYAHINSGAVVMACGVAAILIGSIFFNSSSATASRQSAKTWAPELPAYRPNSLHASDPSGTYAPGSNIAQNIPLEGYPATPSTITSTTVPNVSASVEQTIDAITSSAEAAKKIIPPLNLEVLKSVRSVGDRCGYNINQGNPSVGRVTTNFPKVDLAAIGETHCSAYSASIFADVVARNAPNPLNDTAIAAFKNNKGEDGVGPYGYFNAFGFGTAMLFNDTKMGKNFSNDRDALPGDFVKILWATDSKDKEIGDFVGMSEGGHSVVYVGSNDTELCFAGASKSGNLSGKSGCGIRCVPKSKIKYTMFSRLTDLAPANQLSPKMKNETLVGYKTKNDNLATAISHVLPPGKSNVVIQ